MAEARSPRVEAEPQSPELHDTQPQNIELQNIELRSHDQDTAERPPAPRMEASVHSLDLRCVSCPGHHFRRSRLRAVDLQELLRFRYPVRCLSCNQRQFVGFTIAGISLSSYARHHKPHMHRGRARSPEAGAGTDGRGDKSA